MGCVFLVNVTVILISLVKIVLFQAVLTVALVKEDASLVNVFAMKIMKEKTALSLVVIAIIVEYVLIIKNVCARRGFMGNIVKKVCAKIIVI